MSREEQFAGSKGGVRPLTDRAAIQTQLRKIADSVQFTRADRLRRFLEFIVTETLEGRGGELKETVVAIEVFGRSSFDPRTDSVVRVEARNLRSRLTEFYSDQGVADTVIIELPKGGYLPSFRYRPPAVLPAQRPRAGLRPVAALSIAAAIVVAGAFLATRYLSHSTFTSLAVLPFRAYSPGTEVEQFGEGLADELMASLAQLPGLKVVSRTSSFQFRDKSQDARSIGRQLGAEILVEGGVRRVGGNLRVTIQLINSADGFHVWSKTYDRDMPASLGLPDEAAQGIARALGLRAPSGRARPMAAQSPASLTVRDLYWTGKYLRNRAGPGNLQRAARYFEAAVAKDPQFGPAYAALADAYTRLGFHMLAPSSEVIPKARDAARLALERDENLAEAHAAMGIVHYYYDWDWKAAEQSFRRAIEADPNFARAHQDFALALTSRLRHDEALAHARKAAELDPLSSLPSIDMALILFSAGRYQECIAAAGRAAALNSASASAEALIGTCTALAGKPLDAVQHYQTALARSRQGFIVARLGAAHALAGHRAEALRALDELCHPESVREFQWVFPAQVYAALGDRDHALECLEKAVAQHDTDVLFMAGEPLYQGLRGEPRFKALLARFGM